MSDTFEIGAAFSYGVDKLTTRGGALLLVAYIFHQLAAQVSVQSLFAQLLADTAAGGQVDRIYPLAIDVPVTASGGLFVLLLLVGMALMVVATRALYADIDRLPTADHTRRLGRTVAATLVVSIIYGLAVGIGTVLFIVPGLFLAVSLVFAQPAVILEDAGVIEALKRSWSLTSGNRLKLFGLGVIVAILSGVVGGVIGLFGAFVPVLGDLVSAAVTGVASVFGLAVLVGAYKQLADDAGTAVAAGAENRL